jgi:hypothetical protein
MPNDEKSPARLTTQEQLREALNRLSYVTQRLKRLAFNSLSGLGIQLVLYVAKPFVRYMFMKDSSSASEIGIGLAAAGVLLYIAMSLFHFDRVKREGDSLFEEISEELHWTIDKTVKSSNDLTGGKGRPDLEARVIMRNYAANRELPLAPGKLGPMVYLVMAFGMFILSTVIANLRSL